MKLADSPLGRVVLALALTGAGCGALRLLEKPLRAADGPSPLVQAIRAGDLTGARKLLRGGARVDAPEKDGTTALHWACFDDNLAAVRVLLSAGANPSLKTQFGVTPLVLSSENGSEAAVTALLQRGADARADSGGQTALHVAARVGAVGVARLLLSAGAAVDARETWQFATPLMIAASGRHTDVVKLLIEGGADVNVKAAETKLFIGPGDESTTYTQIPRGGMTALMFAARDGCVECIGALAAAGANVNYQDPARVTPLNLAIYNGRFDTALRLLEVGADPNDGSVYLAVDVRNLVADGVNADHHPAPRTADALDSTELLRHLLVRGADPDDELLKEVQSRYLGFDRPRYVSGLTPLHRAAQQADLVSMKMLLDHRADPNRSTRSVTPGFGGFGLSAGGETPLQFAVRSSAGVPASILGNRPGKLAYRSRELGDSLAAVRLLLDRGADVNGSDWSGSTALHVAAVLGAQDIIAELAARGATLDAKNDDGKTALELVMAGVRGGGPPGPPGRGGGGNAAATAALLRRLMGLPDAAPGAPGQPSSGAETTGRGNQ